MSDAPIAGTYQTRLVKGGPWVPVMLYFGLPIIGGEEQDRGPRWCVVVDGATDELEVDRDAGYRCRVAIRVDRYWPYCGREPIGLADYHYMVDFARWAKVHAPHLPQASPRSPVKLDQMKPILPPTR